MPIGGEPEAEPELGVVLEQGVRPGRAAPVGVGRPRRGRQVAPVDRRAAGGVGDHEAVAEQLGEQLEVRRLAAACARAGELEQRLEELGAAHGSEVDARRGRSSGSVSKNAMFSRSATTSGSRGARLIALLDRVAWQHDRARLDAQPAARAVLDVDLQRVPRVGQADGVERSRPERIRSGLRAGTRRSTSSGSRCAGTRSCSCRTGCRDPRPRPPPARRCCASRRPPCRSGRCRRPGAR